MNELKRFRFSLYTLVLTILISLSLGFLYQKFFASPNFRAESVISVDTKDKRIIKSALQIINSGQLKTQMIKNLKLDLTVDDIDKKVTFESEDDSYLITIKTVDSYRYRASDISDELADLCVRKIQNVLNVDSKVIDYSYEHESAIRNNKNIYYFLAVGIVVALVLIFMDSNKNVISSPDQIRKDFTVIACLDHFVPEDFYE